MLARVIEDIQSLGHRDWIRKGDVNKTMNLVCKFFWEKETLERLGTMGYSTHPLIYIVAHFLEGN